MSGPVDESDRSTGYSQDSGPNTRSYLTLLLIIITITVAIRIFGLIGAGLARLGFVLLAVWFIYRYLKSQRGYRDRYQEQGKQAANLHYFVRWGLLLIIFIFSFSFTLTLLGDPALAFLINAVVYAVVVQVADDYASRDMREYVANKRRRDREFVDSISDPANIASKCMSCQRKIDRDEKFCPHCGFEQKEIRKDIGYADN